MIKTAVIILSALVLSACSPTNTNVKKQTKQPIKPVKSTSAKPDCYDMGYKWGVCAAKNTNDRSCTPGKDAVISENCMDEQITQQGIKDGIRSIQKKVMQ